MKRGTPDHPKMFTLAEALYGYLQEQQVPLSFELCHTLACGIFERLCHFTARYAPAGDIGKHSDIRIAKALGWTFDPAWLITVLVTCKQVDTELNGVRLYVHDWHDHSDDGADKWLYDHKLRYANGSLTRRGRKSRQDSDEVATQTRQSEPEPGSFSGPESEPKPPPSPAPTAAVAAEVVVSWDLVTEELQQAGVLEAASAVRLAKKAKLPPQEALAIVRHFTASTGAWDPGAILFRLRTAVRGKPAGDGWPPPAAAHVSKTKEREASAARMAEQADRQRKASADRIAAEKLEKDFGSQLDAMPDAELNRLVNGNIVIEARLKKNGRTAPLVREYLLGELARREPKS